MGVAEFSHTAMRSTGFRGICLAGVVVMLLSTLWGRRAEAQDNETVPLRAETRALLAQVGKSADAGRLSRAAQQAGASQLIAAVYRGTRAERYAALDALRYADDPGASLPVLAALLAATDRGTAARAAGALLAIVETVSSGTAPIPEAVPGQLAQLQAQLASVVRDARLDGDIRIVAATASVRLSPSSIQSDTGWVRSLLDDSDSSLRLAALSFVSLPMADDLLLQVAKAAGDDGDSAVRAAAARLLCENALAHKVEAPSADLTAILKAAVEDSAVPKDILAGVLVCLSRFTPSTARSAVVDAVAADERPEVGELLKSLKLR